MNGFDPRVMGEANAATSTWIRPSPRFWLSALLLFHLGIHIPFLSLPPCGSHQWRQTQTLAVARNFHEEGMNIFKPRVDGRGEESGIAGMEFPLVNFMIALGYRGFGFHHAVGRGTILAFSILALVFCYLFFRDLIRSEIHGLAAAAALGVSPLFMYYSITVLPDLPSLALLLGGLYFCLRWDHEEKIRHLLTAAALLAAAALIKITALAGLPYFLYTVYRKRRLWAVGMAGGIIGAVGAWYWYARYLNKIYHINDFFLGLDFPLNLQDFLGISRKVLLWWFPRMYLNYFEFIFFLGGLYWIAKGTAPRKKIRAFLFLFGVPFLAFMLALYRKLEAHDYYIMTALPLLAAVVAAGAVRMFHAARRRKSLMAVLLALAILSPALGLGIIASRFRDRSTGLERMGRALPFILPEDGARVVVCSDISPSTYLYFFHRKGWSITLDTASDRFIDMVRKGARYLISNSREFEEREDIKPLLVPFSKFEAFRIFLLKPGKNQLSAQLVPLFPSGQSGKLPSSSFLESYRGGWPEEKRPDAEAIPEKPGMSALKGVTERVTRRPSAGRQPRKRPPTSAWGHEKAPDRRFPGESTSPTETRAAESDIHRQTINQRPLFGPVF